MVANVIVSTSMSQKLQFLKGNIVNINRKAVLTFLLKENTCATTEPPLPRCLTIRTLLKVDHFITL